MGTDADGDDDDYVCGAPCGTKSEPCQFPVDAPDERCHNHPKDGSGPPDGVGSGTTSHSMGDGDGKIQERLPDGAKPAMSHGLHAVRDDPMGTIDWLEDNDPRGYAWVIDKWRSYLADAPFPPESAKADDVLMCCLMLYAVRGATHIQVERGFTEERPIETEDGVVMVDGEPYMVKQERPENLPTDRVARQARSWLRDLGVLDDPQSKQAEAMGWGEAAKKVAQRVDAADVETVGGTDRQTAAESGDSDDTD